MKNKSKTHGQLLTELAQLRRRTAELEASGRKRNQFEKTLRAEKDKAQQYLDIAEVMLVALNKKGEITLINRKGRQILEYKKGELFGKSWFTTCVPSRLRKKIKSGFLKLMAGERQLTEFYENPALTKSGTERMMAWHNALLKDAHGNIVGTLSSGQDITERKQAEETLRESESKFRNIMENSKDGIIFFDGKTRKILFGNRAMAELLGCSEEDLIGRSISSLHPSEEWSSVEREFQKHVRGEISLSTEIPVIRNDGSVFYADISSSFITLEGRPYFAAFFRDITERKVAEEALQESEEKYRNLVERANDGIGIGEKGIIRFANKRLAQIAGYSVEEVIGVHVTNFFIPEEVPKVVERLNRRISGEDGPSVYESALRHKDGSRIEVEINSGVITYQGKKVDLVLVRDITERKQTEVALRNSEERFRLAFENANTGVCLANLEGNLTRVNNKMCEIFGYTREELEGMTVNDIAHPEDVNLSSEFIQKTLRGEIDRATFEKRYIHKKGHVVTCEVSSSLVRDAEGAPLYFISHLRDITEQKRAEVALKGSETKFRELFESMSNAVAVYEAREDGNDFVFKDFNRAGEQIEGITRQDIIGKSVLEVFPRIKDFGLFEVFQRVWHSGKPEHFPASIYRDERIVGWRENYVYKLPSGEVVAVYDDITDRKQAEEGLRESEARFRTLVEAIPDTVLVHDDKGAILHINEIGAQRLEWSAKDLVGRNLRDIVTPENATSIADHVKETHKVGWSRFETTYVSRSGWRTIAEVYEHPIVFGKKKAILSVARDISERKDAEEKLRASEEKYRDLVENINDIIYAVDEQGIITYIAPTIESISGYTVSEIIGRPFFDFVYEEDTPYMKDALQQDISGQAEPHEYRTETKQGDIRWVRTFSQPFFEGDRLAGLRGVLTDITERKQAEEALLREKIFSDAVMDSLPGLFFVLDDKGYSMRWNKNVEKISGYSAQEIAKMNILDFVAKEDKTRAAQTLRETLSKGHASLEINVLLKSGKKIPFYLTGLRTQIENITCIVGSGFDITQRKQAEEALQRSYDQLQETFISSINALASTVEMKDQYTAGHQPRVTQLACAIAKELGLSEERIEGLRMAGLIHDIGKIVVPAEILNKPGPLTDVQYEMIKMHPQAGYDILKGIKFPWPVAQIVQQHHEMMDGSGYPQGLTGEEILPEARILAVANVVEAMNAHRPYRPAHDIEETLTEISQNRGVKYDPAAADACLRLFTEKGFVFDSMQY